MTKTEAPKPTMGRPKVMLYNTPNDALYLINSLFITSIYHDNLSIVKIFGVNEPLGVVFPGYDGSKLSKYNKILNMNFRLNFLTLLRFS